MASPFRAVNPVLMAQKQRFKGGREVKTLSLESVSLMFDRDFPGHETLPARGRQRQPQRAVPCLDEFARV
jgi:hypothetical protein